MLLSQLLKGIAHKATQSNLSDIDIASICSDSRKASIGDLYVALKGGQFDGNDYIENAFASGAVAAITESDIQSAPNGQACLIQVDNAQKTLHCLIEAFYGNPSKQVRTVGITGTNGKTTVAYLIEAILKSGGKDCGVIGTVNYRRANSTVEASQTTPDILENQKFLAELLKSKIPYCAMEVSSHALSQDRVQGISFCAGIFTNLTGDHLDYHKTLDRYFESKSKLFSRLESIATAIINADDAYGRKLPAMTGASVFSYGIHHDADLAARDIHLGIGGSSFTLVYQDEAVEINSGLIGIHNIYNALAATAFGITEGISLNAIAEGIASFGQVPGRLEKVFCERDYSVFIDYAHTQDALSNVLSAMRQICAARILLVFGCGGDRDKSKRKLMGQVACELADFSFITSDNPRTENPQEIIEQIKEGFQKGNYAVVPDRKEAIRRALAQAQKNDVVLLAGKGHETYQILGDRKVEFNERAIIRECLA